jgi:hypothetical protein
MSTPKAGRAVVASVGETGGLPVVRNILAPVIIAWRQRLGSAGAMGIEAGIAELAFVAAEAIAIAYVVLTGDGLAGGCSVEVDVTA